MKKNLCFLLPFAVLVACSQAGTPHDHADHTGHEPAGHDHAEHSEAGAAPVVQLDNGKTWAANTETTEGVQAMKALVEGYDPATGDGVVLKEELKAEFDQIFAKCTMTGDAHEQLHNYLIPLHKMLDGLGADPSATELDSLREYLGTYGNYFH